MTLHRVFAMGLTFFLGVPVATCLGGEAEPTTSPAVSELGSAPVLPRLTGIISAPGASVALFDPGPLRPAEIVTVGERLGGWVVLSISPGIVKMANGSQQVTLVPNATMMIDMVAAPDWKVGQRRSATVSSYLQRRQPTR